LFFAKPAVSTLKNRSLRVFKSLRSDDSKLQKGASKYKNNFSATPYIQEKASGPFINKKGEIAGINWRSHPIIRLCPITAAFPCSLEQQVTT
jgi:hypothetical protein